MASRDDLHCDNLWPRGLDDDFLLREGLDLLSAFRAIRSDEARRAILVLIAAIAQAEHDAES